MKAFTHLALVIPLLTLGCGNNGSTSRSAKSKDSGKTGVTINISSAEAGLSLAGNQYAPDAELRCVGFPAFPIFSGVPTNVSKIGRDNCVIAIIALSDLGGNSFTSTAELAINYANDQTATAEYTFGESKLTIAGVDDQSIPADLSALANGTTLNVNFQISDEFLSSTRVSSTGTVGARVILQIDPINGANLPLATLDQVYVDDANAMLYFFWSGGTPTFEDDFINDATVNINVWRPWVGADPTSYAEFLLAPAATTTAKGLGVSDCTNDAPPAGVDTSGYTNGCIWYALPFDGAAVPDDVEVFGHALVKTGVGAAIFYSNEMTYTN